MVHYLPLSIFLEYFTRKLIILKMDANYNFFTPFVWNFQIFILKLLKRSDNSDLFPLFEFSPPCKPLCTGRSFFRARNAFARRAIIRNSCCHRSATERTTNGEASHLYGKLFGYRGVTFHPGTRSPTTWRAGDRTSPRDEIGDGGGLIELAQ